MSTSTCSITIEDALGIIYGREFLSTHHQKNIWFESNILPGILDEVNNLVEPLQFIEEKIDEYRRYSPRALEILESIKRIHSSRKRMSYYLDVINGSLDQLFDSFRSYQPSISTIVPIVERTQVEEDILNISRRIEELHLLGIEPSPDQGTRYENRILDPIPLERATFPPIEEEIIPILKEEMITTTLFEEKLTQLWESPTQWVHELMVYYTNLASFNLSIGSYMLTTNQIHQVKPMKERILELQKFIKELFRSYFKNAPDNPLKKKRENEERPSGPPYILVGPH